MLTLTVKDIVNHQYADDSLRAHPLYVAREGDVIFYVGMSKGYVVDRVLSHLGLGPLGGMNTPSPLGHLIISHLPESDLWVFDFFTLSDCEHLTGYFYSDMGKDRGIRSAEIDLIKHYAPCLNTVHNAAGRALPEKYLKKDSLAPRMYSYDLAKLSKVNGAARNGRAHGRTS